MNSLEPIAMDAEKTASPGAAAATVPGQRFGRRTIVVLIAMVALIGGAAAYAIVQLRRDANLSAAHEALARRDFAEARRFLEQSLEANPKNQEVRILTAQTARRQGDLRGAAAHLQECDQRGKPSAELELERRLLRVQQGDLAAADDLLAQCAGNPQASQSGLILEAVIEGSLVRLVEMFRQESSGQGQLNASDFARAQRAVDLWRDSRSDPIDQGQEKVWRGLLHALARESAKSTDAFRAAVALDPNSFRARELLAKALITDEPEESARHFEILHRRDPKHEMVSFHLAQASRSIGNLDRAEQVLDELLAANPDHPFVLVERGRVALDRRRPQDAERWLRRAVRLAPDDPQANLQLSLCLQQTDREEEARQYHDKYVQAAAKSRQP
jgi:tetratricopeptide (TPR) repeat protein